MTVASSSPLVEPSTPLGFLPTGSEPGDDVVVIAAAVVVVAAATAAAGESTITATATALNPPMSATTGGTIQIGLRWLGVRRFG